MSATICPSCSGPLVEIERSGIHIDACRQCRGVWLDRGELDKLVAAERASDDDFMREMRGDADDRPRSRDRDDDDDDDDRRKRSSGFTKPTKKRKSIFEEFLDFG